MEKNNKINNIFIFTIIIEIIILAIFYYFLREVWVVVCDISKYSLLNPFLKSIKNCMLPASMPIFNPQIYLLTDLLIFTIISYAIYLMVSKSKRK